MNTEGTDTAMQTDSSERYIRFSLGEEEYAMPLLSVREVIAMPDITRIPQTPPYFLGIMNLRGQVITILDLRTKLGIKPANTSEVAVIICDLSSICIGVVVDSINSVLTPKTGEISERPVMQGGKNSEYITGIYRKEAGLVLLLDISKLLSVEDQGALAKTQTKKAA